METPSLLSLILILIIRVKVGPGDHNNTNVYVNLSPQPVSKIMKYNFYKKRFAIFTHSTHRARDTIPDISLMVFEMYFLEGIWPHGYRNFTKNGSSWQSWLQINFCLGNGFATNRPWRKHRRYCRTTLSLMQLTEVVKLEPLPWPHLALCLFSY